MNDYPNDADGDAIRRIAKQSNMSKPMLIDFVVEVPDEGAGRAIASIASMHGYESSVEFDASSGSWTCYCKKRMLLTYDAVIAAQRELDDISASLGGHTDGWGTLGN